MVGEHYLLVSPRCIKESQNLFFLIFPFFLPLLECNCCSFSIVEFMTHRTYADCWTCIIAMQFNKRAHVLGKFNYI